MGKERCWTGRWAWKVGNSHYLYAVQLLGQDAEKVIRELAQQGWVPVPIAPLVCKGSRAQDISPEGGK